MMKITISTIDDKYRLNFDGSVNVTPYKFGVNKNRTLGGRLKMTWRGEYNKILLNIDYITNDNYLTLKKIWSSSTREIVVSCENGVYTGLIVDETLSMIQQYDYKGDIFYSGTINMEE